MSRAERIREEASLAEATLLKLAQNSADLPAPPVQDAPVVANESTVVEVEPVAAPTPSALERDYKELEHKHNTLQGMFARQGAEVGVLRQQMDELARRVSSAPAPAAAPVTTAVGKLTAKDREEYGEELIGVIRRAAHDTLSLPLQTIVARLDRLEKGLNETTATATSAVKTAAATAQDKFYATVSERHADWEKINATSEWLTWLAETDPMTGMRRDDLLQDAHRNLDAGRVIAIFSAFKRETGKSDTASGGAKSDAGRIDPKTLVAPSSSASPQPVPSAARPKGKIWKQAEAAKVYDDFAKGKIDAPTFRELEADIMAAAIEGRVQQ
jgi:outer membrane murein-binding lipoprotein Lpp